MPKWILLIVLAALALGSAFFFTRSGESTDFGTLENEGQKPVQQVEQDQPAVHLRGIGGDTTSNGSQRNAEPETANRTSVGPQITVAAAGGEFHVLLLNPKSRAPLEGVNVYLLDREKLGADEWRNAGSNLRDLRKLVKERGVRSVSDREGGAYFERVLDGAIWAEGSGWQGYYDWIGPPESPLELKLTPHSELEVIVLDDEGKPVRGVPMAVLAQKPEHWVALLKRNSLQTGIVQFPGVSKFSNRATKSVPLAVGFHFPHGPRAWQVIDPEWLPEDPIEMRLPPSASLTLRVVDGEGKPFKGNFTADLGMANDQPGERVTSIVSRRGNNGQVTFPFVGLGSNLRVQLSGKSELKNLIVDVRGPSQGEEDAVREIAWFERRLRVSGVVRGPGGLLANRRLQASWGDGHDRRSVPLTTDDQGSFSVPMVGTIGAYLHLRVLAQGKAGPCEGKVMLPQPLPNGEWNAGVVHLEGETLFAEGRVVDLAGNPIAGARVKVESWQRGTRSDGGSGKAGGSKDGGGKSGGAKADGGKEVQSSKEAANSGHWRQVGRLYGISDERGYFKIYGRCYNKRIRLTATHREHLSQSIEDIEGGMPPVYFNLEQGIETKRARPKPMGER